MANLLGFVVRRLLASIVVVWAIITIVFFLAHASPYDPVRLALGRFYTVNPSVAQHMRHIYGLDLPLWRQYFRFLWMLLQGNLGYSSEVSRMGVSVWVILQGGVPVTMKLGLWALIISLIVGLPAGLYSALHQNSFLDHFLQGSLIFLYVIPIFVLVPFCQLFFGAFLHWLPVYGWGDGGWTGPFGFIPLGLSIKEMVLPVACYAAGLAGFFAKSFRSFVLEVMRQDYIRTARAKGLKNRVVVYLHACKNTLLPLASIVGPTIAFLIVGAFLIEYLFSIPGIAYITVSSIQTSDYDVIEATTIMLVVLIIVVNMLTDIFYAIIDPRVRLE